MAMTEREATAGIGQRVTDCETNEVGILQGLKHRFSHYRGVVAFPSGVRDVWLRRLSWTEGLRTPHTLQVPYGEILDFFHHASSEDRGTAVMRKRLFKRLFGREPTANERLYMSGKWDGSVCQTCGDRPRLTVNPMGSVDAVCYCVLAAAPA